MGNICEVNSDAKWWRKADVSDTRGNVFLLKALIQVPYRNTYRIKMGIAYTGELELELIEWVSGETPHKEFLEAGRSGMHHLSFHVPDLDAVVEHSRGLGYEPIWYHRMSDEIAYTYLERPGDPLLVELTERPWSGGNVQLGAPAP